MPDEPETTEARLKIVETTLAALVREVGGKLHGIFEKADQALAGVVAMRSEREKGVDITARVLALIAIAASTAIGLVMHFHPSSISQEANPRINVDTPDTDAELHDQRVRDLLNMEQRDARRPELLPGPVGDDSSAASGTCGPTGTTDNPASDH